MLNKVGVDCAILMNPQTWVASGHLGGFSDPLMDCKECHERFRADKLIEDFAQENNIELDGSVDGWSNEKMVDFIESHNIPCPSCGKHNFTDIRQFNLMFKTFQGVTEDAKNTVYLRPETAQGIFVNFKNVQRTSRIPESVGTVNPENPTVLTRGSLMFLCCCRSPALRWHRATDACIGCGKCVELCPLNNIRLENGKPVWGKHCTHCMACICYCPKEAIEYGNHPGSDYF